MPSAESDVGPDPTTPKSGHESKPRVGSSKDWATQVLPSPFLKSWYIFKQAFVKHVSRAQGCVRGYSLGICNQAAWAGILTPSFLAVLLGPNDLNLPVSSSVKGGQWQHSLHRGVVRKQAVNVTEVLHGIQPHSVLLFRRHDKLRGDCLRKDPLFGTTLIILVPFPWILLRMTQKILLKISNNFITLKSILT